MFGGLSSTVTRVMQTVIRGNYFRNSLAVPKSWYASSATAEDKLKAILQKSFPAAKNIAVEDISGGCGAMYNISVESSDFKGLSIVKQHQAVTNALKEQIKHFHGLRIETKVPK